MQYSLSYVHGASDIPLLGTTIGRLFDSTASRLSDRQALVVPSQGIRWSWHQLKQKVDLYAAGLLTLGLGKGDRIGIWAPNRWEWVVTQFATARIGLLLVNINPAYRPAELAYALEKTGCRALITAPSLKSSDYIQILYELLPTLSTSAPGEFSNAAYPELKILIRLGLEQSPGFYNFEDIPARASKKQIQHAAELSQILQFDDAINIQFTSGTTGAPKAATLTHHNIVNNAYFVGLQMHLNERDRMCIPVPMYHCFGMVLGTLCCVASGATMVFASAGFDPHSVLQVVQQERCTALHGVPTMFIAELEREDFSDYNLSSLRTGIMAGAPCPVELMKRVINDMNLKQITIAYGMTETGPVSFQTSIDDPEERRVNTVGRVLPHIEIKIVDEEGRVVPTDTPGELLTRGYCVMPGYWNDPDKNASSIDQAGWIASGDIANIDTQGYCQIVGRLKDMLIRGGENIFPREIEEFFYTHPKIEQVEIIGVPDLKYGEQVCAWIKLHAGESLSENDIIEFCQNRIAHFKIPHYIRFVDSFPMTVTGKVQKFKMREIMREELNL